MNVCFLTHTFPKNPNESTAAFLHALVVGMEESGIHTTVLTPYHKNLTGKDFPYKIVVYRYVWPTFLHTLGYATTLKGGTYLPFKAFLIVPFLFVFGAIQLYLLLRREKIDIICSHWIFPSGVMAALVSKVSGIPFTITLPGSDVYVAGMNKVFKRLAQFAANSAGAIIADSPVFVDKIKRIGAKPRYTEIIPYPVNVDTYKPSAIGVRSLKKKLGFNQRTMIILAVGRLVEKKGFYYLLTAMKDIVRANPQIRLVLVGDGDLRGQLEKYCEKIKIKKYVLFVGNISRSSIVSYYNMADMFVMPSIADTQGNIDDQPVALLEAMSCGQPVVATNFPGIALSVENGINGFLVPQKDVNAITGAAMKLSSSKELRITMGEASRKIALSKFSSQKIATRYTRIFQRILHER